MDVNNIEIKKNIASLIKRDKTNMSELSRSSGGLTTQSSLSKLNSNPEESNPTVRTLRGLAHATGTKEWMFLVPDFPFNAIKGKPLNKISHEGYTLLQAFEQSSESTRLQVLKQLGYLLKSYDHNEKQASIVEEAAATYSKK